MGVCTGTYRRRMRELRGDQVDKNKKHTIEVIVDRLIIREGIAQRLADSLETVLDLAGVGNNKYRLLRYYYALP